MTAEPHEANLESVEEEDVQNAGVMMLPLKLACG